MSIIAIWLSGTFGFQRSALRFTQIHSKDGRYFRSKEQKRYFIVRITEKQYIADTCRSLLGTEHYKALGNFRAGVEGVPSVLRRVYGVDALPVRGLIRSRIWDHGKMMACNFKSFFHHCRKNEVNAPSCSFIFIAFQRFIRYFKLNSATDLKYA